MPTGIDHIVIVVRNLAQVTEDYTRAGFTVIEGGEHKDGVTHNALVAFDDGAYFELIAFKNPDQEQAHKWWHRFAQGEGLIDYALRTDNLDQEVQDLRDRGLDASDPIDGGRFRPDGVRLDWQTIRFDGASSPALPFYCFDLTERHLRVPDGEATHHANGITGVAGVTVVVGDMAAVGPQFAKLTNEQGESLLDAFPDAEHAQQFRVANAWVQVVQPTIHASDLRQQLELHGDSLFSVSLTSDAGDETSIPIGLAHGARLLQLAGSGS
ncbi:MAG: VOC family protein [Thermomicrobiales bacterium]